MNKKFDQEANTWENKDDFWFLMQIDIPDSIPLSDLLSLLIQLALFILICIFILVGFRVLKILGVAQQLAESISEIVETVNLVLWQPVRFFGVMSERIKKFLGIK